ncbi:hypothetical protein KKE92_03360 [Candidatus Micrarchaeota archaeon]|nr:hypothetical protein [Candidatus Micrarchaeota archaeon]MBU1681668.1 hypothetical protein [Candidatus Micrarchaeota archaeon]
MIRNQDKKTGRNAAEKPSEMSRRAFFRVGGTALAMGAAISAGLGTLLTPRTAHAAVRRIGGRNILVVPLERALSAMDSDSEQYRGTEHQPTERDPEYRNGSTVPRDSSFIVGLNNETDTRGLTIVIPTQADPMGVDLNDFVSFIRTNVDHQVNRVKLVIDRGTIERDGETVNYTDVLVIPIDSQGRATTPRENGEYLVFGASKTGDEVGEANMYVLKEPSNEHTIPVAPRA